MNETKEAVVSETVEKIIGIIEKLTVLELAELVKALEDKFGVSAAPVMALASPGAAAGPAEEKPTEFTVVLSSAGDKKIQVLKVVRELTGLGLKEAKDLVDNCPRPVKEKVAKAEADTIKAKIEEQGGVVEIK